MRELTERQRRFVEAYTASGNATDAARQAGYSDPGYGRQIITIPNVAAAIAEAGKPRASAAVADRTEREEFLTSVMRKKRAELRDRLKAAELLGRMQGDFVERMPTVITGGTVNVAVYIPDNARG